MKQKKKSHEAEKAARKAEAENLHILLQIEQVRSQQRNDSILNVPSNVVPKLRSPKFDENVGKVDACLYRFERFAISIQQSCDEWAIHLSLLLMGKAPQEYVCLSVDDSIKYDVVKRMILH